MAQSLPIAFRKQMKGMTDVTVTFRRIAHDNKMWIADIDLSSLKYPSILRSILAAVPQSDSGHGYLNGKRPGIMTKRYRLYTAKRIDAPGGI